MYLHAPVFMGPVNAAEGTGVMLLSGDPEQCAVVLPDLERMTGKGVPVGAAAGAGGGIQALR